MTRLETYRDNVSGSVTVKGQGFAIVVSPEGTVAATGNVIVAGPPALPNVYDDTPSPRSRPAASRKRGSR
ncbi:MAG TPA: hypothetical protein VGI46_06895 [Candidatus Acidoferrum sp.]|jgi:hypothetical protein